MSRCRWLSIRSSWYSPTSCKGRAGRDQPAGGAGTEKEGRSAWRDWFFRTRTSEPRIGRNPATGEQIKIPARTRLRFTPAKALKDEVLDVPLKRDKKAGVSTARRPARVA